MSVFERDNNPIDPDAKKFREECEKLRTPVTVIVNTIENTSAFKNCTVSGFRLNFAIVFHEDGFRLGEWSWKAVNAAMKNGTTLSF